jgi:putative phosphoribosyl transferase
VCLEVPTFFSAVGQWYRDFGQTSDAEVSELLAQSCCGLGADTPGPFAKTS